MSIKEVSCKENQPQKEKQITYSGAIDLIKKAKEKGLSVVHVSGVFDVMHMGHVDFLRAAKSAGDILIVGLEPDVNVKLNKGDSRPINNTEKRMDFMSEIGSVDFVFAFEDEVVYNKSLCAYRKRMRELNPDFIAICTSEDNLDARMKIIQEEGMNIALIYHKRDDSTTKILQLMGYEGEMQKSRN